MHCLESVGRMRAANPPENQAVTTIQAVYADGVLTPKVPLDLPEGSVVEFTPHVVQEQEQFVERLERELEAMMNRTPEEIQAACDRIDAKSTPPRPLPPGMTFAEVVQGCWPGDESDEQVAEALERLS